MNDTILETLDLVPFLDLCSLDLKKSSVLVIYEYQFVPSLVVLNKVPPLHIGFYSTDPNKLKYASLFKVNIVHDLEAALMTYDYVIFCGLTYNLESIR